MTSETISPVRALRSHTLRVVELLSTRVQSVRIELVGTESSKLTRIGAVLVYLPLLLIGYALILASIMRLVATAVGWGVTCFLFGAVHLAVSAWGISRGDSPGAAKTYDVVDPELATPPPTAREATADTLPDVSRRAGAGASRPRTAAAVAAAKAALLHPRAAPPPPSLSPSRPVDPQQSRLARPPSQR